MELSHVDDKGNARMVDVSEKGVTAREAVARGRVYMSAHTVDLISQGKMPKGDVFSVARVAGIMAAKRTFELIPMCHNIVIDGVKVELSSGFDGEPGGSYIEVEATVKCSGRTGVEMEALTAVSVAALTIYDMCKAVDKEMIIGDVQLVKKTGGKSDFNKD
jgi:cyclic pyranopterin phosphate synthase